MRTILLLVVMNLPIAVATASAEESKVLHRVANPATVGDSPVPASAGRVNAKDFGATGDGATDDTAALQRAVDARPGQGTDLLSSRGAVPPRRLPHRPSGSDALGGLRRRPTLRTSHRHRAAITQSGADICTMAVRVDRTQPHAGVQFVNGQFMSTLVVGPQNQGPVKLVNCGFWPVAKTQEQVVKLGPSTLMLTSCHFAGWDGGKKGNAVRAGVRREACRQRLRVHGRGQAADRAGEGAQSCDDFRLPVPRREAGGGRVGRQCADRPQHNPLTLRAQARAKYWPPVSCGQRR